MSTSVNIHIRPDDPLEHRNGMGYASVGCNKRGEFAIMFMAPVGDSFKGIEAENRGRIAALDRLIGELMILRAEMVGEVPNE